MVSPSVVCSARGTSGLYGIFLPFELLFGRKPRRVLDLIKENWEEGPSPSKSEIQYVMDLQAKLHTLGQLSLENLLEAQERQQHLYNRGTKLRHFLPGDKVLVLLLTSSTKLLSYWITKRTLRGHTTSRGSWLWGAAINDINLLKAWKEVVVSLWGDMAQEVKAVVWQSEVYLFDPRCVEVSLSKTPNPKLLPMSWLVPCMAVDVWMGEWEA